MKMAITAVSVSASMAHVRGTLSDARIAQLEALGVAWNRDDARWERHLVALAEYVARERLRGNGDALPPPPAYAAARSWAARQLLRAHHHRTRHRRHRSRRCSTTNMVCFLAALRAVLEEVEEGVRWREARGGVSLSFASPPGLSSELRARLLTPRFRASRLVTRFRGGCGGRNYDDQWLVHAAQPEASAATLSRAPHHKEGAA